MNSPRGPSVMAVVGGLVAQDDVTTAGTFIDVEDLLFDITGVTGTISTTRFA